jgi:molecular chaperone DnaK
VGGGVYHVQHVLGDNRFGGNDLDAVVTAEILADLSRRGYRLPTKGIARRRVAIAAEYLKIALSGQEEAEYTLVGLVNGDDVPVRLTRPRLAELEGRPPPE